MEAWREVMEREKHPKRSVPSSLGLSTSNRKWKAAAKETVIASLTGAETRVHALQEILMAALEGGRRAMERRGGKRMRLADVFDIQVPDEMPSVWEGPAFESVLDVLLMGGKEGYKAWRFKV